MTKQHVFLQVTGLSQPILLERMSEVLAGAGSLLDRGHSSRDLEKLMAAYLNATEMKSFQNLWQRLDQLASAVYHKVRLCKHKLVYDMRLNSESFILSKSRPLLVIV